MANVLSTSVYELHAHLASHLVPQILKLLPGYQTPAIMTKYLDFYLERIAIIDTRMVQPQIHADVLDMINFLRERADKTLSELIADFLSGPLSDRWLPRKTEQTAERCLKLGADLWLMLNSQAWKPTVTLSSFIEQHHQTNEAAGIDLSCIKRITYTAEALKKISNFNLVGTTNILDHLSFRSGRRQSTIKVFDYHAFLRREATTAYPDLYLREALQTLSLLYHKPDASKPVRRISWRRTRRGRRCYKDLEVGWVGGTSWDPQRYHYWRQRLLIIQHHYDLSQPKTFKQLIHDRRRPDRYYALWIAIFGIWLTAVIGIVQSILTGLQLRQR